MAAANLNALIGYQGLSNSALAVLEVADNTSGYVPKIPVGTIATFTDPYWGGLEAVRLSIPVSTAVAVGTASTLTDSYGFVAVPNTANLGQPVAFASIAIPSNATYVQYAWFIIGGKTPVFSSASVAANSPFGITAAGQVGANSAGKQILSGRIYQPATTTVVKANSSTTAGSPVVRVTNSDGWFVGLAVTGTGIPASTTITAIDTSGTFVTLSNSATATGTNTLTATYTAGSNFWNVAVVNRPMAQGAIT